MKLLSITEIKTPDSNPAIVHHIRNLVESIVPFDSLEKDHRQDALDWIDLGHQIFRIKKPDTPNKHLVSYFVLYDPNARKILLVDHKMAELWLPSGGHVELNEDPTETVKRECLEELGVSASFYYDHPIFLTVTTTVGMSAKHTDVPLWYVLKGDHRQEYIFDTGEFYGIQWFDLDHIPLDRTDPHLGRFIKKLQALEMARLV